MLLNRELVTVQPAAVVPVPACEEHRTYIICPPLDLSSEVWHTCWPPAELGVSSRMMDGVVSGSLYRWIKVLSVWLFRIGLCLKNQNLKSQTKKNPSTRAHVPGNTTHVWPLTQIYENIITRHRLNLVPWHQLSQSWGPCEDWLLPKRENLFLTADL